MEPDWSELMSDLHKVLKKAESELRLVHMDPNHKSRSLDHFIVVKSLVSQLERWCHE